MYPHRIDFIADDRSWDGNFDEAIESLRDSSSPIILISDLAWDIEQEDIWNVIEDKSDAVVAEFLGVPEDQYADASEDERERLIQNCLDNDCNVDKLLNFFDLPKNVILSVSDSELLDEVKNEGYCDEICDFISDEYAMLLNGFSSDVLMNEKSKSKFCFDDFRLALEMFDEKVLHGDKNSVVCGPWEIEGTKYTKDYVVGLHAVLFRGDPVILSDRLSKNDFALRRINKNLLPSKAYKAACYLVHNRFSAYSISASEKKSFLAKDKAKTSVR